MRVFVTLALIFQLIFSSVAYGRTVNSYSNTNYFKPTLVTNLGTTQLTLSGLVNAGLDGVITSGLSSAVYGTDFGAGVVDAITRAVVMSVAGASIQEVSDLLGHDVASLEKTIGKATINCLAAKANGASCASAALGTLVVDLGFGDAAKIAEMGVEEAERRLKIASLVVGFLASEGKGENVDATVDAAVLDFENNVVPLVLLVAVVAGALTAADVVLTANDAYNLAREGLACDGGDTAACARVLELSKQFAIETGVTLTVGAIVPGDKIGMKIIAMMRKKGDDDVIAALDKAEEVAGGGSGAVPADWKPVSGVGAQINTPKGFTSYATPDGQIVHVSPSGLRYGNDKDFGNRVDHVLDHTSPTTGKPKHTVFNAQGDDALALVDEAWTKKGSPVPNDPGAYVVPMGRTVGTNGETSIRVIVKPGTNEIISAYPY